MVPIAIYAILGFVFSAQICAQQSIIPDEEWLIYDARLECAMNRAVFSIMGIEYEYKVNRDNEFASNALAWEWYTYDYSRWIRGAVFQDSDSADDWWSDQGFIERDDDNPDDQIIDYKQFENLGSHTGFLKMRGIEDVSVEGTYWWIAGRFVFKIGPLTYPTDGSCFAFLKGDANKILNSASPCKLFDPIIELTHFEFFNTPTGTVYYCGPDQDFYAQAFNGDQLVRDFDQEVFIKILVDNELVTTLVEHSALSDILGHIIQIPYMTFSPAENLSVEISSAGISSQSTPFNIKSSSEPLFEYPATRIFPSFCTATA